MPAMPPSSGLPMSGGLAFDTVTLIMTITAMVMLIGLALLLWAMRARDQVTYVVRCPVHGRDATVQILTSRGNRESDVEACSLCDPPTRVDCGKRCLRLVA